MDLPGEWPRGVGLFTSYGPVARRTPSFSSERRIRCSGPASPPLTTEAHVQAIQARLTGILLTHGPHRCPSSGKGGSSHSTCVERGWCFYRAASLVRLPWTVLAGNSYGSRFPQDGRPPTSRIIDSRQQRALLSPPCHEQRNPRRVFVAKKSRGNKASGGAKQQKCAVKTKGLCFFVLLN